jgi:hypothetical protein
LILTYTLYLLIHPAAPVCHAATSIPLFHRGPPRLHWGKAGWPDPGCWRGEEEFGDNWCHFGCARQELDPQGKFMDEAGDRWSWARVDLQRCCTPSGFDTSIATCQCQVQRSRSKEACPPAPFYTNR